MLILYLQAGLSPSSLRRALARKWMKERARQEHSQGADLSLEVLMVLCLVEGAELLIKYPALFSGYPSSIQSLHQPAS